MKTIEEVIKANECCDHGETDSRCEDCPYNGIGACCAERESDALQWLKGYRAHIELDKLRDKCETENDPLSWDELRTMEGKPVWVEYNFCISNEDVRDNSKRWCIIREFKPWHDTEIIITENGFVLSKREQVTDWQAYRKER